MGIILIAAASFNYESFFQRICWLLCPCLVIVGILLFLAYLRMRKTFFRIEYAGGCIAFDISLYAKAEIDDFQKQMRRAKDLAEETSVKTTPAEPLTQTAVPAPASASVPDDLRKYADLLKDGLISQEEYDAIKKKTLGL
ncbi:MAG: SHOCT domain-containing protein [Lachnospiraceae bacterium]|nr:SHOCT domain-containing protein [Lachnospiraceae bacterium]